MTDDGKAETLAELIANYRKVDKELCDSWENDATRYGFGIESRIAFLDDRLLAVGGALALIAERIDAELKQLRRVLASHIAGPGSSIGIAEVSDDETNVPTMQADP